MSTSGRPEELERVRARAVRWLVPFIVASDLGAAAIAGVASRSWAAVAGVLALGAVFALFGLAFARERGDPDGPGAGPRAGPRTG